MRSVLVATLLAAVAAVHAQPTVYYHAGSSRKISQLTGDYDRPWGCPTTARTYYMASLDATDLGSTFEHNGNLVFLFGDTWGGRSGLLDSWGTSSSTDPWNVNLQINRAADGKWRAIQPPGLNLAEFCVPSHGISHNGSMYVVFTQPGTNGDIMRRSWMIASSDNGVTWQTLYQLDNNTESNPRFVNVWLEEHGDYIYMFGCGAYRASSPYLARALKTGFPQKSAWEFYTTSIGGQPIFTSNSALAGPLFSHNQLGEFSCCWISLLNCWVMLYNSGSPRGITMRTAATPWGPWSAGTVIMDPGTDQAYGNFMHVSWDDAKIDTFSDPGRQAQWGGEYGPYIIPRFTGGNASRCELYYTMSTWNPYQVILMRSIVSTTPPPGSPSVSQQTLGHDRWNRYPADVATTFTRNSSPYLTTYNGDGNTGWLWQKLPPGTTEVSFKVHGGNAEIFLLEDSSGLPVSGDVDTIDQNLRAGLYGRIARRATGVQDNATDISWAWNTRNLNASSLALVVLDSLIGSWGFVSFSEITVKAPLPGSAISDWALY